MRSGKTTKHVLASAPFRAAGFLRTRAEMAAYLEAMLEDGDVRAVPVALRTVAEAMGGISPLAEKTRLSRETTYRALFEKGQPRLDTLGAILGEFGLRITVIPRRNLTA